MIVVPLAKAAIIAMIGISSIKVGIISPPIVMPCNAENLTSKSAAGSPLSVFIFRSSISPPISFATRKIPSLVGLIPTFFNKISDPGTRRPAAIK